MINNEPTVSGLEQDVNNVKTISLMDLAKLNTMSDDEFEEIKEELVTDFE